MLLQLPLVKRGLTHIGATLSTASLLRLQAVVNYLMLGHWMRERGFVANSRARNRKAVWDKIIERVADQEVLYLEFGVAGGASISYWSASLRNAASQLHGFDSFEGLPESGGPWEKGQFDVGGMVPKIDDPRVKFFKGWFDEVLPSYQLPSHQVLVVNMDADLYSSTIYVLRHLCAHIRPGTFIYFDELNHMEHEPRAFDVFLSETGRKFELVAVDHSMAFAAFRCVM